MTTQAERWAAWKAPENLDECVLAFFEILDIRESSDMNPDKDFAPNYISSCRVWDTYRMGKILERMKTLAYQQQQMREMKEWNL